MQIPKNVVQRYVLSIQHRYDAVFAVGEGRTSLTEVNRFRRDRDNFYYSFSSEKLVIFKNDPLSKYWRTAWTDFIKTFDLFNVLMQN